MRELAETLTGFHRKTFRERHTIIKGLYPDLNGSLLEGGIDISTANLMIENCVGKLALPLGLALNFCVGGREYIVPMCTEEPSIVAGASAAAKLVAQYGGFTYSGSPSVMRGQIQCLDVSSTELSRTLTAHKGELINKANKEYCPKLMQRGGGVFDITIRELERNHCVVEVHTDVCQAMGANIVNTLCEYLSEDIQLLVPRVRIGLRILSNFCTDRVSSASFEIPVEALAYKGLPGSTVAQKLLEAHSFAQLDIYRACTHNKGILNGVVALGQATGQDTRAIEASCHVYASRTGSYKSLSTFSLSCGKLRGEIELPLAIGTQGGAIPSNSVYSTCHYILEYPSSAQLAGLMAAVGLACNLAALRAMVTEGIQTGHMSLHAKNIALGAGVPNELVEEVAEYMKQRHTISQQAALDYMAAHSLHRVTRDKTQVMNSLNTFSVNLGELSPPLKLTIAFDCKTLHSVHVNIDRAGQVARNLSSEIKTSLFGKHNYNWILGFVKILRTVAYEVEDPRENMELRTKLKVICIWVNLLSSRILQVWDLEASVRMINDILYNNAEGLSTHIGGVPAHIEYGLFLFKELWHVFNYLIDSWVSPSIQLSVLLASSIKQEMLLIITANLSSYSDVKSEFNVYFEHRKKQMCAPLMYLCDYLGSARISIETISQLKSLGNVLETISTSYRDFHKYMIDKGSSEPNAFSYYREYYSMTFEQAKVQYFEYAARKAEQEKENLPKHLLETVVKAEKLIQAYYIAPKL